MATAATSGEVEDNGGEGLGGDGDGDGGDRLGGGGKGDVGEGLGGEGLDGSGKGGGGKGIQPTIVLTASMDMMVTTQSLISMMKAETVSSIGRTRPCWEAQCRGYQSRS